MSADLAADDLADLLNCSSEDEDTVHGDVQGDYSHSVVVHRSVSSGTTPAPPNAASIRMQQLNTERQELVASLQREQRQARDTAQRIKRLKEQIDGVDAAIADYTVANAAARSTKRLPASGTTTATQQQQLPQQPCPPSRLVDIVRRDVELDEAVVVPAPRRTSLSSQAIVNPLLSTGSGGVSPAATEDCGDFTERYSKLRLKSRLIASSVLDDRMRDATYVPLCDIRRKCAAPGKSSGKWVIVGVLVEVAVRSLRGDKASSNGSGAGKFAVAKLSDLDTTTVNLLLFGAAYEALWNEMPGTVLAICSPELLKPTDSGAADGVKIKHPEHVLRIGRSKDMGTCRAIRRDGQKCSMVVNTNITEYCDFHIGQATRGVAMNRPEFMNDQARRQISEDKQKRLNKSKRTHGVYFTEGQLVSTMMEDKACAQPLPSDENNALVESTINCSNFGAEVHRRMQGVTDSSGNKKPKLGDGSLCITSRQGFREMFAGAKEPSALLSDSDDDAEALAVSTKLALEHVRKNGIKFARPDPNKPFSKPSNAKNLAADIERRKREAAEIMAGPPKPATELSFAETEQEERKIKKQSKQLASQFNVDLDKERIKAQNDGSNELMTESERAEFLRMCKREEYKEKHQQKMENTFQMTITGYACKQCQVTTEKVSDHCRQAQHIITRVNNATKRFFRCVKCPSSFTTTVNSLNPRQRCKKCDERQWKVSSMLRTNVKKIVPERPQVRGVEHDKFLS